MDNRSKYYKNINMVRVIACIGVLLYHLNILKGGYLAVSTFFVLSSFLSCLSLFKKEKVSLKDYYVNLIKRTYLPLLIVVFVTIAFLAIFPVGNWLNLKPETTSILLNYNNYWQLNAKLDYFARQVNSPFIHLWYISILLQFDLILPFIFILLRKLGDKCKKIFPCIITLLLAVIATVYFYLSSINQPLMHTYYGTFSRLFSLLFGLSLGFFYNYYGSMVAKPFTKKTVSYIIFIVYLLALISLFTISDINNTYWQVGMILVTLISCRLVSYSTVLVSDKLNIFDKIIEFLAKISYGIYLFQYPLIFIMQYYFEDRLYMIIMVISITITLSIILYYCLQVKVKNIFLRIIKYLLWGIGILIIGTGIYFYIIAKDHTAEMKLLEEQLANNSVMFEKRQEDFLAQQAKEKLDWQKVLEDLEKDEANLKNVVNNLSVIGIGDSVMLGAVGQLYQQFPKGYFDAQVSRTAWTANDILINLKNKNVLGDPIVFHLGTNGDCSKECKIEILKTCGDREVFWINVTNDYDVHINDNLLQFANEYNNVHIIDWNSASKGHQEYFYADGIHLTPDGVIAYSNTIYDAIYKIYLEKYNKKKEEIIKNHENIQINKISFYGNDLLLNVFDYIKDYYNDANVVIDKDFSYETLYSKINGSIKDGTLTNKVAILLDTSINIDYEDYLKLIDLCKDRDLYLLMLDEEIADKIENLNNEKVHIIPFYNEIKNNKDYLMVDKIHLTTKGNMQLKDNILKIINNDKNN